MPFAQFLFFTGGAACVPPECLRACPKPGVHSQRWGGEPTPLPRFTPIAAERPQSRGLEYCSPQRHSQDRPSRQAARAAQHTMPPSPAPPTLLAPRSGCPSFRLGSHQRDSPGQAATSFRSAPPCYLRPFSAPDSHRIVNLLGGSQI